MDRVNVLASDEFGGRDNLSPGGIAARAWLAAVARWMGGERGAFRCAPRDAAARMVAARSLVAARAFFRGGDAVAASSGGFAGPLYSNWETALSQSGLKAGGGSPLFARCGKRGLSVGDEEGDGMVGGGEKGEGRWKEKTGERGRERERGEERGR